MKWKAATRSQLLEIAYHDQECGWQYKIDATCELMRRAGGASLEENKRNARPDGAPE